MKKAKFIIKDVDVYEESEDLFAYLRKNDITAELKEVSGPNSYTTYNFEGSRESLTNMLREKFEDEGLSEEIETLN